jgi:hypothetical protein
MAELLESQVDRGPIPGTVVVSLVADEDMLENTIVTFGSDNQACKKCDAADFPLGWLQGAVDSGKMASVHLFTPMWKAKVATTSDAVVFGDVLECAADGTCKRAETTGSTILGYAMSDAAAGEYVLYISVVCCPTAVYTE